MRTLFTFIKKEFKEQLKTNKVLILGIIFVVFAILNPIIAYTTPLLLEILEESGMVIEMAEVSALDSWAQFFKNMPMLLIAFVLIEGNIFSKEYNKGTLVLVLSKGLERYKIVISKLLVMVSVWTIGYFVNFLITYVFTAVLWDNSVANNLSFSIIMVWIFGLFVISLFLLSATLVKPMGGVLGITGGIIFVQYLLVLLPTVNEYLPILMSDGTSLVYGLSEVDYYIPSLIITLSISVLSTVGSVLIFNKKKI